MWEEAHMKRVHGADIPSDADTLRSSHGGQNIERYTVLYYLATSFNVTTY